MVKARLHIICGNCGCNDEFTWEIVPNGQCNQEGNELPDVYIRCGNCATLHTLSNQSGMSERGVENNG